MRNGPYDVGRSAPATGTAVGPRRLAPLRPPAAGLAGFAAGLPDALPAGFGGRRAGTGAVGRAIAPLRRSGTINPLGSEGHSALRYPMCGGFAPHGGGLCPPPLFPAGGLSASGPPEAKRTLTGCKT